MVRKAVSVASGSGIHSPGGERKRIRRAPNGSPVLGRHRELLKDPKIKSWWEGRSLRSRLSADTYLRQLGFLMEHLGISPDEAVRLAREDPDKLRDLLINEVARLKNAGRLDSYVSKFFEGLRSYLKFNRVAFDGFPALSPIRGESLVNERIPTPEELGRVLDRLSLRGRVAALFMAHAGVRPGVLCAYQGAGGLTLKDIPDLVWGKTPSFREIPFVVRVPATLSKTRVAYTTFGSSQLASAFLAYLDDRSERGENLGPESPVIAINPARGIALKSLMGARHKEGFLTTTKMILEIADALNSSAPEGLHWRPYVLRAYCSTRLMMAEGAGKITRDLREELLDHYGGIAARYHVGKAWGPDLLKDARASYKRSEAFLNTVQTKGAEDVVTEMRRTILMGLRYSQEELNQFDLGDMENAEFQDLIERRKGVAFAPAVKGVKKQKLVDPSEVTLWLEQGFTVTPNQPIQGKILLSPP